MKKTLIAFLLLPTFIILTPGSIKANAFSFDSCDDVLKKDGYRCNFEAFNKNRVDKVFLGGVFVPNNDVNSNPFAAPFLFEIGCVSINLEIEENGYYGPVDNNEDNTLNCGCNPKSPLFPILNASDVFTCVGDVFDTLTISFSGKSFLGGRKIINSNFTTFINIPDDQEPLKAY
ncbi:MAG TPA: hypothetical protein VH878_07860, partial [Thermodesulfobacteriota bacterium]